MTNQTAHLTVGYHSAYNTAFMIFIEFYIYILNIKPQVYKFDAERSN